MVIKMMTENIADFESCGDEEGLTVGPFHSADCSVRLQERVRSPRVEPAADSRVREPVLQSIVETCS